MIPEDTITVDMLMEELPGIISGTVTDNSAVPIESVYVEISEGIVLFIGLNKAGSVIGFAGKEGSHAERVGSINRF